MEIGTGTGTGTGANVTICDMNPFTKVWCALWTMAERNDSLTDLVRMNNRIKYYESYGPKDVISDGDLPELMLLANGGTSNITNSSSTSHFIRRYTWALTTGEYDINEMYHIVSWELYRAMVDWDVVLCALEWPESSGWHFVVRTNVLDVEEGTLMTQENRGIRGWVGMWNIDVEMHFNTSDLRLA